MQLYTDSSQFLLEGPNGNNADTTHVVALQSFLTKHIWMPAAFITTVQT